MPAPVAIAAGSTTAAAANTSSATADGRRHTAGRPTATTPNRTTAPTIAKSVVRKPGTASAFQMPASDAKVPSVPSPGSARAANAAIPACGVASEAPRALAISHGNATSAAAVRLTAAHSHLGAPRPGTTAHTSATVAAIIKPVAVSPASAIQNTSGQEAEPGGHAVRSRSTAVATQGRHP